MSEHKLQGRRIAVLAADGFEKVELTVPVAVLRAAGAAVEIVSLRHGRIRGVNLHEPAARVAVDRTIDEAKVEDYEGLLIPGGYINPDLLRQSEAARDFVRQFNATGKPIATLCHGPWLLASAGLAQGRTMTSWPGIRDDLVHAGAIWQDEPLVRDGNLVTSRGPQDLLAFVRATVEHFQGEAGTLIPSQRGLVSAPQRKAPPEMVLRAMKWLPRPSLRTAAFMAALLALYAISIRHRAAATAS